MKSWWPEDVSLLLPLCEKGNERGGENPWRLSPRRETVMGGGLRLLRGRKNNIEQRGKGLGIVTEKGLLEKKWFFHVTKVYSGPHVRRNRSGKLPWEGENPGGRVNTKKEKKKVQKHIRGENKVEGLAFRNLSQQQEDKKILSAAYERPYQKHLGKKRCVLEGGSCLGFLPAAETFDSHLWGETNGKKKKAPKGGHEKAGY